MLRHLRLVAVLTTAVALTATTAPAIGAPAAAEQPTRPSGATDVTSPASLASLPPLPGSMAAIGDSITVAYDACCYIGSQKGQSWSTGGSSTGPVLSHYERIRLHKPSIDGNNVNLAVAGAKMSAGPGQAAQAVSRGVRYVTILLGANDVCTSSVSTMTSVASYRASFVATMDALTTGLPKARIFVASIPNVRHLWSLFQDDWWARYVWDTFDICPSVLADTATAADRQAVVDRITAFNQVLADVCAEHPRCRDDGGAVFSYPFTRDDVSTVDYFHPSRAGQAHLADVTWTHSWWPTL